MRERLLDALLGGEPHPLEGHLERWLQSRRFAKFAREHLPKVRKKLRGVKGSGGARDLLLELSTAYGLVEDKRLTVVYEPVPGGSSRGPDFAVSFTTRLEVMVEVTRLRPVLTPPEVAQDGISNLDARLGSVLVLKLGQLVSDRPNVLLIGTDDAVPSGEHLSGRMSELRREAESLPEEALSRAGYRSRGDYLKRWAALSTVIVVRAPLLTAAEPGDQPAVWVNPAARAPLPNDVLTALVRALGRIG